ncbi:hypothetical protein COR50_02080 [Chitinophaga caeni]|uniref:DUF1772 domain-containing protein n=1 Tax=Chitinophaga caeni TaxID=2029983 RepID=A0A291QQ48_9BACT|nr:anthrone oxygenase family protein [Chitinophaga caeni]ATL46045.1 hypothetical protein COR50_02080 [Chitinophaga caeni]
MGLTSSIISIITCGLIAGIFFAFSIAINPAFSKLDDLAYIKAMQHINESIQNLLFLACFLLPCFLLPVSAWLNFKQGAIAAAWLFTIAALLYIIGVFGLTIAVNVPLNNQLATLTIHGEQLSIVRHQFSGKWNLAHTWRTALSIVVFIINILALCAMFKGTPAGVIKTA